MAEYPFEGTNIEILKITEANGDTKFEIYVDPKLHTVLLSNEWKNLGARKAIGYKSVGGEVIWAPTDTPCT